MRLRTLVAAVATAATLTITPGIALAAPITATHCRTTQPDGSVVRLGLADNGRSLCLRTDQRVLVVLSVDPQVYPDPSNWWTPITEDGAALAPLPLTILPVRGTTIGSFRAVQPGAATLSSTWSICPPGPPACGAPIRLWRIQAQVTA